MRLRFDDRREDDEPTLEEIAASEAELRAIAAVSQSSGAVLERSTKDS
jgi:hypothetical protein